MTRTILGLSTTHSRTVVREVNGLAFAIDSITGSYEEALLLARMYALEHAYRLDVEMFPTASGGKFMTNNGTPVIYSTVSMVSE